MTTRFHLESWRKLYRTLPPSWLALPLSARGLGDELLKYVDDDGVFALPPNEKEADAVCRIMCAHRDEWKRVAKDLDALVRDGFLVREPNSLRIRNFALAQGRTPSAHRMARMRERQRNSDANSDAPVTVTVTSRSDGSDETRRDTTRHELESARGAEPLELALEVEAPKPSGPVQDVWDAYLDGWRQHVGRGATPVLTSKREKTIKARLKEHPLEVVTKAAGGIWASSWHRENSQTSIDLAMRDAAHVERFAGDPVKQSGLNGTKTRTQLGLQQHVTGEYDGGGFVDT